MYDRTMENRLHLFENITADSYDTIYELLGAFHDLCKILSRKEVLTDSEFNDIVNKRRYKPTGETAPVVHAHWIKTDNPDYSPFDDSLPLLIICSNCNYEGITSSNYCPNCGAIMDEEVNDG